MRERAREGRHAVSEIVRELKAAGLFPDRALGRLFERAKEEQWSVDRDVDWDALQLEKLGAPQRRAMAAVYGHIQFGEVVGLSVSARGVADCPELWNKLFGATQVMDEARHVEFFSRVVDKLGGAAPPAPSLKELARELIEAESFDEQLLGTQVILEGFAQTVFQEGARLARALAPAGRIALPGSEATGALLRCIDELVGRDESRHIAFGVLSLQRRWRELDGASRERLERRGSAWAERLTASLDHLRGPLATLGIDAPALKARVEHSQVMHFRAIGFELAQAR